MLTHPELIVTIYWQMGQTSGFILANCFIVLITCGRTLVLGCLKDLVNDTVSVILTPSHMQWGFLNISIKAPCVEF